MTGINAFFPKIRALFLITEKRAGKTSPFPPLVKRLMIVFRVPVNFDPVKEILKIRCPIYI